MRGLNEMLCLGVDHALPGNDDCTYRREGDSGRGRMIRLHTMVFLTNAQGFHHSEVADHEKAQDAVVGSCPWTVWFITPSNCNAQEMMYRKEGY